MKAKWCKPWEDVTTRERHVERAVRQAIGPRICDGFATIADICADLKTDAVRKHEVIDAINRLYQRGKLAASLDKTKVHPL